MTWCEDRGELKKKDKKKRAINARIKKSKLALPCRREPLQGVE